MIPRSTGNPVDAASLAKFNRSVARVASGRDVSGRAMGCVVAAVRQHGIEPEPLIEGLPISLVDLGNRGAWLSWDVYAEIMSRYQQMMGAEAVEGVVANFLPAHEGWVFMAMAAERFVSSRIIYWLVHRTYGFGDFPFVRSEYQELTPTEVRFELSLPPDAAACPIFFAISERVLALLPTLAGQPPAHIRSESAARRTAYFITHAPSPSIAARLLPSEKMFIDSHRALEQLAVFARDHEEPARPAAEPFRDYRAVLRDELSRRRARHPKYSLHAFARTLGMSAAAVSNVLAGRRHLSLRAAASIAQRLGFAAAEAAAFYRLVEAERAGPEGAPFGWVHQAILAIRAAEGDVPPDVIARRLATPEADVRRAVADLTASGLLDRG